MKTRRTEGFTLIEIMVVVAIIGLLAAALIPNLKHAADKACAKTCFMQRKNIDGAKVQWALETRQPSTAVPADDDLFGKERYLEHKPDCPAGGLYSLNAVEQKCTCSLRPHQDETEDGSGKK